MNGTRSDIVIVIPNKVKESH